MLCKKCGNEIGEAEFCKYCGQSSKNCENGSTPEKNYDNNIQNSQQFNSSTTQQPFNNDFNNYQNFQNFQNNYYNPYNTPYNYPYNDPYLYNQQPNMYYPKKSQDGSNFWWNLLSFMFSLIGLILFFVFKEEYPKRADHILRWAAIKVLFLIYSYFFIVFFISLYYVISLNPPIINTIINSLSILI